VINNDGFVSGKDGWSIPVEVDSRHRGIIDDIIELQKDSDLYQKRIVKLDKENQHLFSESLKLVADNAALRKVLEECCSAIEDLINAKIVFENGQYADLYNLIEQTLSKGKTE
jgi:hypothetical protein